MKNTTDNQLTEENNRDRVLLSELGLTNDLYFSLNYHNTYVEKKHWLSKFKQRRVPLDIDLGCALFDENGKHIEMIWFKNLRDESESIRHYGDNLHGYQTETEKKSPLKKEIAKNSKELSPIDLEYIHLNLKKLPDNIKHIVLLANSFQKTSLSQVNIGEVDLQDVEGNMAKRVDLTRLAEDCCSLWFGTLSRTNSMIYRNGRSYSDWSFYSKKTNLPNVCLDELINYIKL